MTILKDCGHVTFTIQTPKQWITLIDQQSWDKLDKEISYSLQGDGFLLTAIKQACPSYFTSPHQSFEHIISLRQGPQDEEEDGIWHDDGTRMLAFSLSLNHNPSAITGGELLLRPTCDRTKVLTIKPRPYGTLSIFATGQEGWEHKTCLVTNGARLIVAGWLS